MDCKADFVAICVSRARFASLGSGLRSAEERTEEKAEDYVEENAEEDAQTY